MVRVRPFAALRPPVEKVATVSAPPYDVMDSKEAAAMAGPESLLHITRPEIDFSPIADESEDRVFERAADNFCTWQEKRLLLRDPKPCYYVYSQTMGTHTQYGIVLCAHADDYFSGAIKKHELTRKDKEDARMKHILIQSANIEPVFFCFKDNMAIEEIVGRIVAGKPEYDFVCEADGFAHKLWVIDDDKDIEAITAAFEGIPTMYIADGHHRSAAAARVCQYKASKNPKHTGDEEYNFFMAVCFPQSQLMVMDYNRLVKDLNGLSDKDFLAAISEKFEVELQDDKVGLQNEEVGLQGSEKLEAESLTEFKPRRDSGAFRPTKLHEFGMYLGGKWYRLTLREGIADENDPIRSLDGSILSDNVLDPILGIKDLRTDKRIDFVGGIRGLGELQARVDSGEMAVAFALTPVTMEQIIAVADAGEIMPPKTTWFEPKLRSGLTIHTFFE